MPRANQIGAELGLIEGELLIGRRVLCRDDDVRLADVCEAEILLDSVQIILGFSAEAV